MTLTEKIEAIRLMLENKYGEVTCDLKENYVYYWADNIIFCVKIPVIFIEALELKEPNPLDEKYHNGKNRPQM